MPIDAFQMEQLLVTRLLTLSVISTGPISIAVAGSTFIRTAGSWLDDKLFPGMEIKGSGFANPDNDVPSIIKAADDLILTVDRDLATEADGSGKSLSVDLPSRRSFENVEFTPDLGKPYIEAHFLPGPSSQITLGPGGLLENDPMYVVNFFLPADTGSEAGNLYGDALVSLFAPRTAMGLTNGDVLRVRSNPGPSRGQLLQMKPGWATTPVTIPLRIRTTNP